MMLEISSLNYHIKTKAILYHLHCSFKRGEVSGILGPNGGGKTTLFKIICGLLTPTTGEILWQGNSLLSLPRLLWSREVAYTPQNISLLFDWTVLSFIATGLYTRNIPRSCWREEVWEALNRLGAADLIDRSFKSLSGGQQQLALIARTLIAKAPILLFDEPLTHLDLAYQLRFSLLLQELAQEGKVVIVALHDLPLARRLCQRLLLLHRGTRLAEGAPHDVLVPEILSSLLGVVEDSQACFSLLKTSSK